jgi:uncharacterized UPF0160 family protein
MDPHFLEFWGNFLVNASKEQRRLKDLYEWMQQGFKGSDDLTEMFRKFYGLDHMEKDTPAYLETLKKASENFLESFKDYLDLMGMVPKDKHLALVQKYEALKEKVADQEENIKNLELVIGFQDLIEKQSKQFQKTMETFGSFFKKENNQKA